MAESVQWIKIKVGMFDGNSFKKIKRAQIGGVQFRDKLTAIWFELLDLAAKGNNNGFLIDGNEIPFENGDFDGIATLIDRESEEINLCMAFFIKEKMIEIIDNIYCLSNFVKYQAIDGMEKIRSKKAIAQAKWREKVKNNLHLSTNQSTCRTTNISTSNLPSRASAFYILNNKDISISFYTSINYIDLLNIVARECPAVMNRHNKAVNNGKTALVGEIQDAMDELKMTADEYSALFQKVNKTFISKPKFKKLDLVWCLNSIAKINGMNEIDETEIKSDNETAQSKSFKTAREQESERQNARRNQLLNDIEEGKYND